MVSKPLADEAPRKHTSCRVLLQEQCVSFRDQFREARTLAQRNAEDFEDLLFALERLGYFLCNGTGKTLREYQDGLVGYAKSRSVLACPPPKGDSCRIPADILFNLVRDARNDALHQGAFARHLTTHATELAIILEDALMASATLVRDFMVRNPVEAKLWQPLSFIRQTMLANSFSYLPGFCSRNNSPRSCKSPRMA